jgi:phosphoribosylformylglycinamidine (FGAM) synthase PurS component
LAIWIPSPVTTTLTPAAAVHRIEVRVREGRPDARANSILRAAAARGIHPTSLVVRHVYFIESDLAPSDLATIRARLLADPVVEDSALGAATPAASTAVVEVHPLPGVMDPAAQSVRNAIAELLSRSRSPRARRRRSGSATSRSAISPTKNSPACRARHTSSSASTRCAPSAPSTSTLGREPTDIELETIAQTWSEHCVHKTLKSRSTTPA